MTRKRCKRRAVVPANPLVIAIDRARCLTEAEQRLALEPFNAAASALRGAAQAEATLADWRRLTDAFNLAEALADLGIARNLRPTVHDAQVVMSELLVSVRETRAAWRLDVLAGHAIDEALFVFTVQLRYCSVGELRRAEHMVRERIGQALAGNHVTGVTVYGAELEPIHQNHDHT